MQSIVFHEKNNFFNRINENEALLYLTGILSPTLRGKQYVSVNDRNGAKDSTGDADIYIKESDLYEAYILMPQPAIMKEVV